MANLGQAFMAINPAVFAPGFEDRLQDLMTYLRDMEPVNWKKPNHFFKSKSLSFSGG